MDGVVEEVPSNRIIGYGAIEEGPDPGSFRIFVVMDPALLETENAALIYDRLAADLAALEAKRGWVQEYAHDTVIRAFFTEQGFIEGDRFSPPGYEEMVVLAKKLE